MMKNIIPIFLTCVLLGCQGNSKKNERIELVPEPDKELREEYEKIMAMNNSQLEELAFEGINIDFRFKNDKPTFGDLFLICGYDNPNFPANSKEFEKLSELKFEQVDDYFGIRNPTEIGDDVLVWLFPIINDEEVYHNEGPFDAIRINYVVIKNEKAKTKLVEDIYNSFNKHLDVDVYFEGNRIDDYSAISKKLTEVIEYCDKELKVEPGSDKAMELEW